MSENNDVLYRAWAEIHTDRLKNNIKNIKEYVGTNVKLMAVVKADAYGHGFLEISKVASQNGADYLAVACIEEAKQLRRHKIKTPILILGATPIGCVEDLFEYDVIPTIFEMTLPKAISDYSKKVGKTLKVHIKLDTGMGRIGFVCFSDNKKESINQIEEISKMQGIEIEGIFTHFASADEENGRELTINQIENYNYVIDELSKKNITIPIKHCCNSAGICMYPNAYFNMVRAGIILYGEYPSQYVKENTTLQIQPVMELRSIVSQVKNVDKGKGISYGQNYVTQNEEKLATVCVGYADSYYRCLSGKSKVIINGKFAPQIGNICMDQMVVCIDGIDNVQYGTKVTLVGNDGKLSISFSDIAKLLGTINYEVMSVLGKRVTHIYMDNKKVYNTLNYLDII